VLPAFEVNKFSIKINMLKEGQKPFMHPCTTPIFCVLQCFARHKEEVGISQMWDRQRQSQAQTRRQGNGKLSDPRNPGKPQKRMYSKATRVF